MTSIASPVVIDPQLNGHHVNPGNDPAGQMKLSVGGPITFRFANAAVTDPTPALPGPGAPISGSGGQYPGVG